MSPFSDAIKLNEWVSKDSGTSIFSGVMDKEWTVGAVPNGGYSLAIIVKAAMTYQAPSSHPDPIHVTAHYLKAASTMDYQVRIRTLKKGRRMTNVLADLVQDDQVRIMAHIIFGVLAPVSSSSDGVSAVTRKFHPPAPYARRHPLYIHPASAEVTQRMRGAWKFRDSIRKAEDPVLRSRNQSDSTTRTDNSTIGGGGVEWGAWFELLGDKTRITAPSLAFLADIFTNSPSLLPQNERENLETSWFPTITMAIEFKSPIPTSSEYASRTVGVYQRGNFMNEPQGRHEAYVEIWTAPSNIGEGEARVNWRERQVCLAVSTQMALTLPMQVNLTRPSSAQPKL
jgi:hypothetical protein